MAAQPVPVDPWAAAFMGAGNAIGGALGGPFQGGASEASAYGTTFDAAGWAVNIGSGQQTATATANKPQSAPAGMWDMASLPLGGADLGASFMGGGIGGWLLALLALGVVVKVARK